MESQPCHLTPSQKRADATTALRGRSACQENEEQLHDQSLRLLGLRRARWWPQLVPLSPPVCDALRCLARRAELGPQQGVANPPGQHRSAVASSIGLGHITSNYASCLENVEGPLEAHFVTDSTSFRPMPVFFQLLGSHSTVKKEILMSTKASCSACSAHPNSAGAAPMPLQPVWSCEEKAASRLHLPASLPLPPPAPLRLQPIAQLLGVLCPLPKRNQDKKGPEDTVAADKCGHGHGYSLGREGRL